MNEYYEDLIEHSMWLNRMRPRIEILQNLLCEEGIIFIQISDEEQAYLKVLCDEVFGRRNFVNMISVNMKNVAGASGGGEDKKLKKNCEFILDIVDKSVVLWYNEEKRTGVFLHGEQLSTARYVRCDVGNSQAVHNRKQGNVGRERKGYPSISEWRVLDFENGSTMERPAAGIW